MPVSELMISSSSVETSRPNSILCARAQNGDTYSEISFSIYHEKTMVPPPLATESVTYTFCLAMLIPLPRHCPGEVLGPVTSPTTAAEGGRRLPESRRKRSTLFGLLSAFMNPRPEVIAVHRSRHITPQTINLACEVSGETRLHARRLQFFPATCIKKLQRMWHIVLVQQAL